MSEITPQPVAAAPHKSLLSIATDAAIEAVKAYGTTSALGQEESQVLQAALKLVETRSLLDAIPVIDDLLQIVATLKKDQTA